MPVRGKAPTVTLIKRGEPAPKPSIEERARTLLVGEIIKDVAVKGDYLTLYLGSGQVLQFYCEGGFGEVT